MNKADFEEVYARTKFFAVVNFEAGKILGYRARSNRYGWPTHKAEVIEYPVTWNDKYGYKHHDGVRVKLTHRRTGEVEEKLIQRKWFKSDWERVEKAETELAKIWAERERLDAYGKYVSAQINGEYMGRYNRADKSGDLKIQVTVAQVRRRKPGIMSYTEWKKKQK